MIGDLTHKEPRRDGNRFLDNNYYVTAYRILPPLSKRISLSKTDVELVYSTYVQYNTLPT